MFSLYANWKSHKNIADARAWYYALREQLSPQSNKFLQSELLEIVIFPPAPLLYSLHTLCMEHEGITVGIQDISPYGEGKHTGLINASSAKGIATHVIVGHAEERKRGDTQEIVHKKYEEALHHHLSPILCISHKDEQIPHAEILAYEPVSAIGTGENASAEDVTQFKQSLASQPNTFVYGGSVSAQNCIEYLKPRVCDGFLVGTTSLDVVNFAALVNTCVSYVEG